MKRLTNDFETDIVKASQSVLLEVMTLLGAYRPHLYLVGGWAPYFLLKKYQEPKDNFQHVGSIDIDLAIDFSRVSDKGYQKIINLLEERGYQEKQSKGGQVVPFAFERKTNGNVVELDFLAGEYGGTTKVHRHQRIQTDFLARKARGVDIVSDHYFEYELKGTLPNRAKNTVKIKVADVVAILTMKGITLAARYKEKDAYDIYAVVAHFKNGPISIVREIESFLNNKLIREGFKNIKEKFSSSDSVGCVWAAEFMAGGNEDLKSRLQNEVFITMKKFFNGIDKKPLIFIN
ncbi:hypothetical protein KKG58_02230 [Patescibacteria group bacterium]|nr:hypothetical protein [Patescibacteria group bacterium]